MNLASADSEGTARWPYWVVVGLLALIWFLLAAQAVLVVDSGRDLGNAWQIAHGGAWPWLGPTIQSVWSLGPVWFYLLAIPLAVSGSTGAVIVLVALLAALKFPLAYALGSRWRDRPTGLAFACLLALPGWLGFEAVVFSHTALTSIAVLACGWLALRVLERPRPTRLFALGLAGGLAMHAHPTALVVLVALALPALAACWRRHPSPGPMLAALGTFGGGVVLPFLPVLAMELQGLGQLAATAAYVEARPTEPWLPALAEVGRGVLAGFDYGRRFLLPAHPLAQVLLFAVWGLVAVLALRALPSLLRQERALLVWVVATVAAYVLFLALTLPNPRAWMLFALLPVPLLLLARAYALGASALGRWPLLLLAVLAVALASLQLAQRTAETRRGQFELPAQRLGNLRTAGWATVTNLWLPGVELERLLARACPSPGGDLALLGDLGYLVTLAEQVPLRTACPEGRMRVGGNAADALAGYPRELVRGLLPGRHVRHHRGFALLAPDARPHAPALSTEPDPRYLPQRLRSERALTPSKLQFEVGCGRGGLLAVTHRLTAIAMALPPEVTITQTGSDGALKPVAHSTATRFYRCGSGSARVEVVTDVTAAVEVLYFASDEVRSQ